MNILFLCEFFIVNRDKTFTRFKEHAAIAGKEDKTKKIKSKPNEPSTAEPAS